MNKTPFEIRAEMLQLAKEYLDRQTRMNIEYAEKCLEIGSIHRKDYINAFKPYTFDDLVDKAKEMYLFISTK